MIRMIFFVSTMAASAVISSRALLAQVDEEPVLANKPFMSVSSNIECKVSYRPYLNEQLPPKRTARMFLSELENLIDHGRWNEARAFVLSVLEKPDRPANATESRLQLLHKHLKTWPLSEFEKLQVQMKRYASGLEGLKADSPVEDRIERSFAYLNTGLGLKVYAESLALLHDSSSRKANYVSFHYSLLKQRRGFPKGIKTTTLLRAMFAHALVGNMEELEYFYKVARAANQGDDLLLVDSKRKLNLTQLYSRAVKLGKKYTTRCQSLNAGVIGHVIGSYHNQLVIQQDNEDKFKSEDYFHQTTRLLRFVVDPETDQLAVGQSMMLAENRDFRTGDYRFSLAGDMFYSPEPSLRSLSLLGAGSSTREDYYYGTLASSATYLGSMGGKKLGYYTNHSLGDSFISEVKTPNKRLATLNNDLGRSRVESLVHGMDESGCFITRIDRKLRDEAKQVIYHQYRLDNDGLNLISTLHYDANPYYISEFYNPKHKTLFIYQGNRGADDRLRAFKFGGCEPDVLEIVIPIENGLGIGSKIDIFFSQSGEDVVIDSCLRGMFWLKYQDDGSLAFVHRVFKQTHDILYGYCTPSHHDPLNDVRRIAISQGSDMVAYLNDRNRIEVAYRTQKDEVLGFELDGVVSGEGLLVPIAFVDDRVLLLANYTSPEPDHTNCESYCYPDMVYSKQIFAVYLPAYLSKL